MPNIRTIVCPYYVANKKTSITCEDCVREFYTPEERKRQESDYCAGEWERCQYARKLSEFYDWTEWMHPSARYEQQLKFWNESKANEITRIKRRLSKEKSKGEQAQRDVYALKHQLQVAKREKDTIHKRAVESEMIYREKLKGLEALAGMLCEQWGIEEFSLKAVQDFRRQYKAFHTISEDGLTVRIHYKKRSKKEREKYDTSSNSGRSSGTVSEAGGEEAGSAEKGKTFREGTGEDSERRETEAKQVQKQES